jgi:hypothetical protein
MIDYIMADNQIVDYKTHLNHKLNHKWLQERGSLLGEYVGGCLVQTKLGDTH